MKKIILIALTLLACCTCAGCPNPPPAPPGPVADAAPPVVVPDAAPAPAPTPMADAGPPAPSPAPPDAGPAPVPLTPVGAACFNLASLGCAEGADPKCIAVMQHAIDARLTQVPLACLTKATTPAAARACGFVTCGK